MTPVSASDRFAPSARCLFTEMDDGDGVLLHMDTQLYFTLNQTGVAVWKHLQTHAASVDEVADAVVAAFDVDRDTAMRDVRELVAKLLEQALVERLP